MASSSRLPPLPSNHNAYGGDPSASAASAGAVAHLNHHYRMERVLYNLHYRLCSAALRRTSRRTRTVVEHGLLVLSVCCFGVLLIVHWSFVYRGSTGTVSSISSFDFHNDTTTTTACRNSNSPLDPLDSSSTSSCKSQFEEVISPSISSSGGGGGGPLRCLSSVPGYRADADVTHLSLLRVRNLIPAKASDGSSSSTSNDSARPTRQARTSYAYIESWTESGTGACQINTNDHDPTSPFLSCPSSSLVSPDGACCRESEDEIVSHIYYSYSRVKGYLLLPPELCHERNLTVQHVVISPSDSQCFGEPFLRRLVFGVTGVDTVMVNWFLAGQDRATGYLLNPRVDEPGNLMDLEQLYHAEAGIVMRQHTRSSRWKRQISQLPSIFASSSFSKADEPEGSDASATATPDSDSAATSPSLFRQLLSKLTVVVKTSFLFFIITTLVSFTLRETQERMIDFTHQLRELYARGGPDVAASGQDGGGHDHAGTASGLGRNAILSWLPFPRVANWHVVPLVVRHLAENLLFVPIMIGMIFFLIEFYRGDKFLAFMVVSLVWLCEVFTVISLRSSQGLHFFPRIFFLLFSLFHFYLFLYPFGFCYTALASTALFMTHSMLFFWHRYELPAVAHGHVTLEHPRMGPHPMSHHHWPLINDHDPSRSHPSPYGPTPPGIPNILLPARRTATPSLLRHPIHHTLPYSTSRTHSTAPGILDSHPDVVVVGGGGAGNVMSRPGSSVALVRDDDSTSSYMYYMDGEVVVHSTHHLRNGESPPRMNRAGSFPSQPRLQDSRRPGQFPSEDVGTGDSGHDSISNRRPFDRGYGTVDVDDDDNENDLDDNTSSSLRSVMGDPNRILDDRSLREALLDPPEPSRLRRRGLFVHSPAAANATVASSRAPSSNYDADAPEMSSLQAILFRDGGSDDVEDHESRNTMNHAGPRGIGALSSSSTPRATNRSSTSHEFEAVAGAPPVPMLRNRRRDNADPSAR